MTNFGAHYAAHYDSLYEDKDYEGECNSLVTALEAYGMRPGSTFLDVGCGTGRHSAILAARGFHVTGTDVSKDMMRIARSRSSSNFRVMDSSEIASRNLQFDVVVSLFDVLSYQTDKDAAGSFVCQLAAACRPGGLVVFDAWHLAGLINDRPQTRVATFNLGNGTKLRRTATPRLDWLSSTTVIDYELVLQGGSHSRQTRESHTMRAFTLLEFQLLAELAELEVLAIVPVPAFAGKVTEDDWHLGLIAKRP